MSRANLEQAAALARSLVKHFSRLEAEGPFVPGPDVYAEYCRDHERARKLLELVGGLPATTDVLLATFRSMPPDEAFFRYRTALVLDCAALLPREEVEAAKRALAVLNAKEFVEYYAELVETQGSSWRNGLSRANEMLALLEGAPIPTDKLEPLRRRLASELENEGSMWAAMIGTCDWVPRTVDQDVESLLADERPPPA